MKKILRKFVRLFLLFGMVLMVLCSCNKIQIHTYQEACVSIVNGIDAAQSILVDNVSVGSGFFYKPGYILTASHNVADSSYAVTYDGDIFETQILYQDLLNDIAILKISSEDYPCLKVTTRYQVGEEVCCFCTPKTVFLQSTYLTGKITNDRINGLADQYLLQTDLPLSPGCSGSAVINQRGEVIAMNAFKSTEFATESLSFCITGSKLMAAINAFENGYAPQDYQIELTENLNNSYGLLLQPGLTVTEVHEGSIFQEKLLPADIIETINGKNIYTRADFFENMAGGVQISVLRNGEKITIQP